MYFGLDIDECAVPTTCPGERQSCANTPGSYRCSCEKHYTLSDGECIKKEKGKLSFNHNIIYSSSLVFSVSVDASRFHSPRSLYNMSFASSLCTHV